MDELVGVSDKGQISQKCHLYEVGIHNMLMKEKFSDEEIENISQRVKEKIIAELKKIEKWNLS